MPNVITVGERGAAVMDTFQTRTLSVSPDAIAPDGAEVRLLCELSRGGMAQFRLPAGRVSHAVTHHTVEEIWYFTEGTGELWRSQEGLEEITAVGPGVSLTIPLGTVFQFRANEDGPLVAIGVTMPPWPADAEAERRPGKWSAMDQST